MFITSPFPWCKGDPVCHLLTSGWHFVGSDICSKGSQLGICCPIAMETAAAATSLLRMCRPRFQEPFWKHLSRQGLLISLSFVIILSPWFSALASFPKLTQLPDTGVRREVSAASAPSGWRWKGSGRERLTRSAAIFKQALSPVDSPGRALADWSSPNYEAQSLWGKPPHRGQE